MRKPGLFALALLAAAMPVTANAAVNVNFIAPEHYTDASLRNYGGAKARADTLGKVEDYLQTLGKRYLEPGDTLNIDVLDVDLAGRFEPWQFGYDDVRFLRSITWPSMKVRYTFTHDGAKPVERETIADTSYQMMPDWTSNDDLHYEKAMLDRWFRARF